MTHIINPYRFGGSSNGLLTNLVSYYSMATLTADSHGSNDLTNTGTVVGGTGVIGDCASFSGTNQLSRSNTLVTGTGALSLSLWLKQSSADAPGGGGLLIGDASSEDTILVAFESSGVLTLRFFGGSATFGSGYADGSFHHVLVTKPSSGSGFDCVVYVDGSSVSRSGGLDTTGALDIGTTYFQLGKGNVSGVAKSIDEVGVWSRVLDATDASNLYGAGSGLSYASFD